MLNITPIPKAVVPVDSEAAAKICGKNYDEFQNNGEIFDLVSENPLNILNVTMPHCSVASKEEIMEEGSEDSIALAGKNFKSLVDSEATRTEENVFCIYQIISEEQGVNQTGIMAYGKTGDIRTEENPGGNIVRNEAIRIAKVKDRINIIKTTGSYIGIVNNVVEDTEDKIWDYLTGYTKSNDKAYSVTDENGFDHNIWIIRDAGEIDKVKALYGAEEAAFVADGNHRSAAAAALKYEYFLSVFFPIKCMNIIQYNRLIKNTVGGPMIAAIKKKFEVELLAAPYQPIDVHKIGFFMGDQWRVLTPKKSLYEGMNAVESLDADIVQREIISTIFDIKDINDKRLKFVGGDRDLEYLGKMVQSGAYDCAITLPPVTLQQFVDVCKQNLFMPPKSTWFHPKIRSGLVIGLVK